MATIGGRGGSSALYAVPLFSSCPSSPKPWRLLLAMSAFREIVGDPLVHGVPLASDVLGPFTSGLEKVETNATAGTAVSASVAALGWTEASAKPKKSFVVALISYNWPGQSASAIAHQTALAAKAAAASTCVGELASPPKVDEAVREIPNSHFFECGRAPNGSVLDGLTTSRGDVFAELLSDTASISKGKLVAVGLKQYRALHSPEAALST
jgi:hypothetical protein